MTPRLLEPKGLGSLEVVSFYTVITSQHLYIQDSTLCVGSLKSYWRKLVNIDRWNELSRSITVLIPVGKSFRYNELSWLALNSDFLRTVNVLTLYERDTLKGRDNIRSDLTAIRKSQSGYFINNRNLFYTALEIICPRSRHWQVWYLIKAPSLFWRWCLVTPTRGAGCCFLTRGKVKKKG